MKKIKYCICVLIILLVCGCKSIPKLDNGEELVVSMGDLKLTVNDFYNKLKSNYGTYTLANEIDNLLLNSVYETTDELTKEVDSNVKSMKDYYGDKFEDTIYQYYGVSSESALRDLLLISLKSDKASTDYAKTLVKDEEIENYYNETTIGDIKASHILILPDVTDDMNDEEKKEAENKAKETAKEIITKLDNGEKFEDLAKEYSKDSTASKGGDLGYFNRGKMVEEFEDASIALKVNEYTKEPVKTQYGYHIILKTDEKEKPKFDDVKDEIKVTLANELVSNTSNINAYAMEWLRKEHNLEIYDSELKDNYEHYMNKQKEVKK